jgi:hypothetical protein
LSLEGLAEDRVALGVKGLLLHRIDPLAHVRAERCGKDMQSGRLSAPGRARQHQDSLMMNNNNFKEKRGLSKATTSQLVHGTCG